MMIISSYTSLIFINYVVLERFWWRALNAEGVTPTQLLKARVKAGGLAKESSAEMASMLIELSPNKWLAKIMRCLSLIC